MRCRVSFVSQDENKHEKKDFFEFWRNQRGINVITFQNLIDVSAFEKSDEDFGSSEEELEKKYADAEPFLLYPAMGHECNRYRWKYYALWAACSGTHKGIYTWEFK